MKTLIFSSIFILCFLLDVTGQWINQHPNASYSFHHVAFVNRWTGWVCGDGVIKKTTNGGEDWKEQTHEATEKYLYCIFPVDSSIVYCVGYWQTILKTTNGGENWQTIRNGTFGFGPSYLTTYFLNKDTGWITGSGFTILKTYDGGNTFDSITTFPISFIYDIRFKDIMTGIKCGVGGLVQRTTNGGYNWYNVNIPLNDTLSSFYKMHVYQNQHCYLPANGGRVFYSSDFGSNWITVGYVQCPGQSQLYCIRFANLLTGWVGGSYGILFKTSDRGHNWLEENTNNDQRYIQSLWFDDTLIGWAVGGGGKIIHTTSGGQTYITLSSNEVLPGDFELKQNYPNPFNSQTTIEFTIGEKDFYKIIIYDIIGREVAIIHDNLISRGKYKLIFKANDLSSGIYYYVLSSEKIILKKKFVLIK